MYLRLININRLIFYKIVDDPIKSILINYFTRFNSPICLSINLNNIMFSLFLD